MNPKILLIDDDPDALLTYAEILGDHGFDVSKALTREAAVAALDEGGPWDVVVLDEYLRGPGGPATATELLLDISTRAPEARTIVISGFATQELVRTAMMAGAWDYLEKDSRYMSLLLPARVRHAVEAAQERRLRKIAPGELERELRQTWIDSQLGGLQAHKKGRLLEQTLSLLFRTIPGLNEVSVNRRGTAEEFDIVVTNDSTDPVMSKEGSFFLVECKNWSAKVDPKELDAFRTKLRDRFGRVRLGLLIGIGGFTEGVATKIARWSNETQLVVLLDAQDLSAWIEADDRVTWLKRKVQAATLRE